MGEREAGLLLPARPPYGGLIQAPRHYGLSYLLPIYNSNGEVVHIGLDHACAELIGRLELL